MVTAALAVGFALGCAWLTNWVMLRMKFGAPDASKFATIDGLRGYLALAVFVHHGLFWWGRLQTREWQVLTYLGSIGEIAVSLFFMITAFLFVGKLLDARERGVGIDWPRLFLSRVRRILPMYLVAMALMLMLVGIKTQWTLQVSLGELVRQIFIWLTFTFGGRVDINGLVQTKAILSGVTWTLPFEWAFYLLLPALALLMRRKVPAWALAFSAGVPLLLLVWAPSVEHAKPFLGGMVAAHLVRYSRFRQVATNPLSSLVAVGALGQALFHPDGGFSDPAILYTALAFCLIAGGASLFGVLTSRASRFLGLPTYSMYLLHGLLIYMAFGVLSPAQAAQLRLSHYWMVMGGLGVVLVVLSHLTYRFIEKPAMTWRPAERGAEKKMTHAIAAKFEA